MPSGDSLDVNPNSTLGAEQIKWLTNHLSSLYRKDITEKPTKFHRNISFSAHILSIEKYMKIVNVNDDLGKICILLESLEQPIKDELLFESDYESNASSYSWHVEKLKFLFPSKDNSTTQLTALFNLKQQGRSFQDLSTLIKSEIIMQSSLIGQTERQEIAVKMFLSGLNAVKVQKPKTLQEAVKLLNAIKVREFSSLTCAANYKQSSESEMAELKKQIAFLTQLVLSMQICRSFRKYVQEKK